ncbi:fatty-acid amide hydrolase 2-B-like isoform X3 [Bombus pyrosoma]|nr:fatty-acid amide hydrolase 2-B-like isoform X3 [Bombus pyrosoma]XP_043595993.1 fatty-acid amide hydrolase 2-B-like isoform X3 [Bombus pyrosoma]XP_043595994.1 fatty-acid amide hydrolase 2-B-like isoform X3 [Bombus pyrosoma]
MIKLFINLIIILVQAIGSIHRLILMVIHWRKKPSIPPIKNPLLKLSATTLARKIRNGELSSQTVVEAYIERIKEVNPFINAVIEDRFEAALEESKICDAKLKSDDLAMTAEQLEKNKPFYGVPISIKESFAVKGMSYTCGCVSKKGMKATEDAYVVQAFKNAGAIPLLVSNVPEYCVTLHTYNVLFGHTMNPYDTRKTSGGSSGGEAALISSGASVLGIGSDLIGSLRIPSFFTGIFTHKPTAGTIPLDGHFFLPDDPIVKQMLTTGPMARYVEDLYLSMKMLAASPKCRLPALFDEPVDIKNLKFYYFDSISGILGTRSTTSEIKETIHKAKQYLITKGASVEEFPQEWLQDISYMMLSTFGTLNIDPILEPDSSGSGVEFTKTILGLSQYTLMRTLMQMLIDNKGFLSPSSIAYYESAKAELTLKLNTMLKDNGVLICPTWCRTASFPQIMLWEVHCSIYTAIANMTSIPATQIPMGFSKDGTPLGFQVMSASYQDHLCLAVAREFEKDYCGWVPPS